VAIPEQSVDLGEDRDFQEALRRSAAEAEAQTADHQACELFELLRATLVDPEKVRAILSQLPGVDPTDPCFQEFLQTI
jgi:hypothetical protein